METNNICVSFVKLASLYLILSHIYADIEPL